MAGALIRFDLSLPYYFTYSPAPAVETRPMIPRNEDRQLYIRGEFGIKPDGKLRPISSHNTTHLDAPYHFIKSGEDLAGILNRQEFAGDRPCLARIVHLGGLGEKGHLGGLGEKSHLGGKEGSTGSFTRDGITYQEAVGGSLLPPADELGRYEALILLTGFGEIMAARQGATFSVAEDGGYHIPYLEQSAVEKILASGLGLVAIDSTTIEPQTGIDPLRFSNEAHFQLLGHQPPVLIVEGLGGGSLEEQTGLLPKEALLQVVPRRVNEKGADAAHSRAFIYFYRDDPEGIALRKLAEAITPEEFYG